MVKENYKLLKQIEHRTPMWTGENTLKSIRTYLGGYYHAQCDHDLIKNSNSSTSFVDWVAKKLGFYESTAGWVNMILAVTIGLDPQNIIWENYDEGITKEQHELSIRKFYEFLEEFINKED